MKDQWLPIPIENYLFNIQLFADDPAPAPIPAAPIPEPEPEDITKNPLYGKIHDAIHTQVRSSTTKKLIEKEFGAKNIDEVKALLELGRKAKENEANPGKRSDDAQRLYDENVALSAKQQELEKTYKGKVASAELRSLYIKLGGLANEGDSKAEDQALTLLMSGNDFEVNDKFELITTTGLSPEIKMEMWLKANPHFKKNESIPNVPGIPGKAPIPGKDSGKISPFQAIDKWMTGGKTS